MAEGCYNAKYLVLHFIDGKLVGTKVSRSWRGAQMSKRNHERPYDYKTLRKVFGYTDAQIAALVLHHDAATRILPIDAILAMKGLEKPDTNLNAEDAALLRRMGIDL